MRLTYVAIMAIFAGIVLTGCSTQTTTSAANDAHNAVAVVNQKVDQAVIEAKPKLNALDIGARVTAAIKVNQNLANTAIRVDASATGVRLRGSVANRRQKKLAVQVAKDTLGPGDTVEDDLSVAPAARKS